jgi:16S rRNA (cytosine1402-N4)-methyltransferase
MTERNNTTSEEKEALDYSHIPVLPEEVLGYLNCRDGNVRIIDGTLGCGGHSSLILKKNEKAEVLGIDRDGDALIRARETLSFASGRTHLARGKFGDLVEHATDIGWDLVDGVLLDLGISSPQIDDADRGFSHRLNGPLDMRMDKRSPNTASRLLNRSTEDELAEIFRNYGEISKSRALARAIVKQRETAPWTETSELVELCEKVLGNPRKRGLPAATLCFQALRIAVNDELGELKRALEEAIKILKPGGRLAVISFHSLEDRIVKQFFRDKATDCICPPGCPVCICDHHSEVKILTRKPVTAGAEELAINRRAASAKLRVAEKL